MKETSITGNDHRLPPQRTSAGRPEWPAQLCQTSAEPMGLEIDHAHGSYVYTKTGRRYLDFLSGIAVANIGHTDQRVVDAIRRQAEQYLHVMVYGEYIQTPQVKLAEKLASVLPKSLSCLYFTNSGTEGVEGALKLSKKFTGRSGLIGFHEGYHGDTQGSLSVTGREVYRRPFHPLLPNVTFLPFNDTASLSRIDLSVAAVIAEPIQGEGGIIIPDKGFFKALLTRCREVGALLIFDEVQTGLGRTGRLFAFEHFDIVPDILVLAKALGGGMPLGAFVASPNLMHCLSVDPPLSHVTTFGGHPVSCAAGLASLEIILNEDLSRKSQEMGSAMLDRFGELAQSYPIISDVRGMGMMIGLDFSDPDKAHQFVQSALEAGLILGHTLHSNTVVRIAPPLTLSHSEMEEGMKIIEGVLR